MNVTDFELIKQIVYLHASITLEAGKEYLVESRLTPLSHSEKHASLESFIAHVRHNPSIQLYDKITDAMTTNETLFFRDKHPFDALLTEILPELIKKRSAQKKLFIWCAASSSGQEPYSLAMLIKEHFPQLQGWQITFLASDISTPMLQRCGQGIYSQLEVNRGLPIVYLAKYFDNVGDNWHIKKSICKMVDFKKINLGGLWPSMPCFDIILMRNVLIYFDLATKQSIFQKTRNVLQRDGYLFLGGAETTINIDPNFDRRVCGLATCYQQNVS